MSNLWLPSSTQGYARNKSESQYPQLWDGLVGYWDFPVQGVIPSLGLARDLSGNGNHGELQGGTRSVPGRDGPALEFDGTGDYFTIAESSSIESPADTDQITFIAWVNVTMPTTTDEDTIHWGEQCILRFEETNQLEAFIRNNANGLVQVNSDGIWTSNEWQQVALTYDNVDLKIYRNGVFHVLTNSPGSGIGKGIGQGWTFGASESFSDFLVGQIDSVLIYNRALIATQINFLFHHPRALVTPRYSVIVPAPVAAVGNPWYYYNQMQRAG